MSTYYKILPEDLNCKGFQYHEGLNVDTNEIDEDEFSYGLHFAEAFHILGYCNHGSMIAEVEIPDNAVVYHYINKSKADRIILKNIRPLWSAETLNALVQKDVNLGPYKDDVLRRAALNGDLGAVKYLVESGTNHYAICDALQSASKYGHLNVVKYLVEQGANVHAWSDHALCDASENGHFDVVRYLVEQGASVHSVKDYAFKFAGTTEIKEYLKSLL